MQAKDFLPIRVSTLRGDMKIDFNVYVQVAGKYVLFCRGGDSFEGHRLKRLKEKKLKKMYILGDQEDKYRQYMTQNIEQAFDQSSDKPIEMRAQIIQGAQQAAAEDVMDNPLSKAVYDVASEGSKRYVDFILKEEKAIRAVMNVENPDHSVSQHGVTVATLAVGMAEKLGIKDAAVLGHLVLGSLLHDIEHFYTGMNLARTVSEMDKIESTVYRKHPINGAERMSGTNFYDRSVLNIIVQHEETINGMGFPNGTRETELDPLAMIAATANSYDRLVTFEHNNKKDALKKLLIDKVGLHSLDHLKALQDVLKEKEIL